jgi:DNA-binding response OmpR family regulator
MGLLVNWDRTSRHTRYAFHVPGTGSGSPAVTPEVLIVAGHEASRDMMREILESAGFRVTDASSAKDAAAAARSIPYDMVVTDVEGDDGDGGVWLLRRLRAWGEPPPVIALTDDRALEHALGRLGFVAVLVKPIDALMLTAAVRDAIGS